MSPSHLLEGEIFDPGAADSLPAERTIDEELEKKYSAGSVRIVTEQARYPLPQIPSMIESPDYRLDPEFQRRHRWDSIKKSRLIESFIINVPIPPIFLYEVGYAKYEVMDGLQRLTAIGEFYRDKLALEGLEEWPELNGRKYSTLPESIRRGVDRRYLSSIVLLQETAKDPVEAQRLKQLVFERINSGGVRLSDQESRNAIYDGPMNRLCLKLSRRPSLCKTWGIPEPDDNEVRGVEIRQEVRENSAYRDMTDVELVLRFFAYRHRISNQQGALKVFLDSFLATANRFNAKLLLTLEELFVTTIDLAWDVFGEQAFWLRRSRAGNWLWYRRPTTVVYDPLMFILSQHVNNAAKIKQKSKELLEGLSKLYEAEHDEFSGRYTNRENLRKRNELFNKLIKEIVRL